MISHNATNNNPPIVHEEEGDRLYQGCCPAPHRPSREEMPPSASEHGPRCADDGRGGEGGAENGDGAAPASLVHPAVQRAVAFIGANSLLAMMFGAIALAWLYPPLGTELVYPDITASWLAVVVIFCESTLSCASLSLLQ